MNFDWMDEAQSWAIADSHFVEALAKVAADLDLPKHHKDDLVIDLVELARSGPAVDFLWYLRTRGSHFITAHGDARESNPRSTWISLWSGEFFGHNEERVFLFYHSPSRRLYRLPDVNKVFYSVLDVLGIRDASCARVVPEDVARALLRHSWADLPDTPEEHWNALTATERRLIGNRANFVRLREWVQK